MSTHDPLSIRQLEVFVALVDQTSFTKAARHLGLSQSTVSGHIADLERRLQVRLVERDRSGVTPTDAGQVLLPPAREVLLAERRARQAVAEIHGLLAGDLTVGGSTIPAVYALPLHLANFHGKFPGVDVTMRTGDSAEVARLVRTGEVDVGLVGSRPSEKGLSVSILGGDRLVLIVPPDHAWAASEGVTLEREALASATFVMREEGSGTQAAMLAALRRGGGPTELNVALRVGSTEAVKAAVRAGLGVAFISDLAVADELQAGLLGSVDVAGFDARRSFHLITREPERMSPAGLAFAELARAGVRNA